MEEKPRPARAVVAGLLVIALVAVVAILARGGEDYRLHVRISNASQLVKGNHVEVGGYSVGTVQNIELGDDNQADVTVKITDEKLTPLHRGTRAWVRSARCRAWPTATSRSSPAPTTRPSSTAAPRSRPPPPSPSVDLDAVLSTLDGETRKELQRLIHGAAEIYSEGGSEGLRRTLTYLDPALVAARRDALGAHARPRRRCRSSSSPPPTSSRRSPSAATTSRRASPPPRRPPARSRASATRCRACSPRRRRR